MIWPYGVVKSLLHTPVAFDMLAQQNTILLDSVLIMSSTIFAPTGYYINGLHIISIDMKANVICFGIVIPHVARLCSALSGSMLVGILMTIATIGACLRTRYVITIFCLFYIYSNRARYNR